MLSDVAPPPSSTNVPGVLDLIDSSPTLSGIIAGIVAGVVVAVLIASVRPLRHGFMRLLRWIASIRITTMKREATRNSSQVALQVEEYKATVDSSLEAARREAEVASESARAANTQWQAMKSLAEGLRAEMDNLVPRLDVDAAYEKGLADKQREIDKLRQVPPKRPRWQIGRLKGGSPADFVILNHAEGATAKNVVVTSSTAEFVFTSSADWQDLSGPGSRKFTGQVREQGRMLGVSFRIEWTAADDERWEETFVYESSSGF